MCSVEVLASFKIIVLKLIRGSEENNDPFVRPKFFLPKPIPLSIGSRGAKISTTTFLWFSSLNVYLFI